jgi:hypothetical protein
VGTQIVDEPDPALEDVLQEPAGLLTVPVAVEGPVHIRVLPSRIAGAQKEALTTSFSPVLYADLKRRRATLICDVDWEYSRSGSSGSGVPWYAKVPLVIEHADTVNARVPTSTGTLSIVTETWAE